MASFKLGSSNRRVEVGFKPTSSPENITAAFKRYAQTFGISDADVEIILQRAFGEFQGYTLNFTVTAGSTTIHFDLADPQ